MKILLTGVDGFIGSHLVKSLVNARAKVSVIVKYNSIINCPRLLNVWDKIKIIESDLRNLDSVDSKKKLRFASKITYTFALVRNFMKEYFWVNIS